MIDMLSSVDTDMQALPPICDILLHAYSYIGSIYAGEESERLLNTLESQEDMRNDIKRTQRWNKV
jgi:hypothetical protein